MRDNEKVERARRGHQAPAARAMNGRRLGTKTISRVADWLNDEAAAISLTVPANWIKYLQRGGISERIKKYSEVE
jgi:hypothetical protein